MPPLETVGRKQKAVLFVKAGNNRYGRPTIRAGVEIDVRWQQVKEEKQSATTEAIALDGKIVVDRDIPQDSLIWLGPLAMFSGTASFGTDSPLMQVVTFDKVPDLKGRNTRRVAGVKRYTDTLPEIVA